MTCRILVCITAMVFLGTDTLLRGQACPEWSSKFDQVQSPAMKQALIDSQNRGWDKLIAQGGDIRTQISAGEETLTQLRATLASATECTAKISSPGSRPTSAQCDQLGSSGGSAATACMCQQLVTRDAILSMEGTLELLHCRAGTVASDGSVSGVNAATRTKTAQQGLSQFEDESSTKHVAGDNAIPQEIPPDVAMLASRGNAIEEECGAYQGEQYLDCSMGVQGYRNDGGSSYGASGSSSPEPGTPLAEGTSAGSPKDSSEKKDDGLDMLARDGTLKPEFVNETSDYNAAIELSRADCDARVQLTLLGATPSPGGSTLHFGISIDKAQQSGADQRCMDLEYTVSATEHRESSSGSGFSDGASQTFHSKSTDTGPIDLQVSANGSNGTELVGWKLVGASCHIANDCSKHPGCDELVRYRDNELEIEFNLALSKRDLFKDAREQDFELAKHTLNLMNDEWWVGQTGAQVAIEVKFLADETNAFIKLLVPVESKALDFVENVGITLGIIRSEIENGAKKASEDAGKAATWKLAESADKLNAESQELRILSSSIGIYHGVVEHAENEEGMAKYVDETQKQVAAIIKSARNWHDKEKEAQSTAESIARIKQQITEYCTTQPEISIAPR